MTNQKEKETSTLLVTKIRIKGESTGFLVNAKKKKKKKKKGNIFGPVSQTWDFLEGQKNAVHEQISQIEGDNPEDVLL